MATYYVDTAAANDTGAGTIGDPKKYISSGIALATLAGDTVYLRAGTFSNGLDRIWGTDFTANGTSWANAITISAYPSEAVTLNGNVQFVKFYNENRSYIIIQNLTLDGTNISSDEDPPVFMDGPNGGQGSAGHHVRLLSCSITNAPGHSALVGMDYAEAIECTFDTNNTHTLGDQVGNGWYGYGSNQLVEACLFQNMGAGGVRFFDSGLGDTTGNVARNNVIHDFSTNAAGAGFGILLGHESNQAYNNLIYDGAGPGIDINFNSPDGNSVLYNTVYNIASYGIVVRAGAANTVVKNNIAYACSVNYQDDGTSTSASNNLTDGTDPEFVDVGTDDFQLQASSPCIDAGVDVGIAVDALGVSRPQGSGYDLGAYELEQGTIAAGTQTLTLSVPTATIVSFGGGSEEQESGPSGLSWPAWVDDDGTWTTGSILDNALHQVDKTQLEAWVTGWTAITFDAANFTGNSGGLWTVASGDVNINRYRMVGKTLHWQFSVSTTTVETANTQLRVAIPGGFFFTSFWSVCRLAYVSDNGTVREGYARPIDTQILAIFRSDGGTWTASTNNTSIRFQGFFEVA